MNDKYYEIILVEDNPDDANFVIRELQKNHPGERIFHIKDGEEALHFFLNNAHDVSTPLKKFPKLVLLDLKMPKLNGIEVLKGLRLNTETRLFPVVVFTSSNELKDIQNAYQYGANSYVVKPVEFSEFKQTVRNIGLYWLGNNTLP